MPKDTFFNLPDAKREAITEIAIEEFAEHAYANVSISRIVARAGIAKGSFYQYFEDKEDLYVYLIRLAGEKKREMFSMDHPDPEHVGVFNYLRWTAANAARFELAYPQLTRLAYRAFTRSTLPQPLQSYMRQEVIAFYRRLVAVGQEQGDISREINPDLAASIFELVMLSLNQIVVGYIVEYTESAPHDRPLFEKPELVQLYYQAIDILERGLRAPVASTELPQSESSEIVA